MDPTDTSARAAEAGNQPGVREGAGPSGMVTGARPLGHGCRGTHPARCRGGGHHGATIVCRGGGAHGVSRMEGVRPIGVGEEHGEEREAVGEEDMEKIEKDFRV